MKKFMCVLLVVLTVIALAAAGLYGWTWYRSSHIFVEEDAYPLDSASLDLRDKDLTIEDYESIKARMPNCDILWMVPFQSGHYPSDSQGLSIARFSQEDMDLLLTYFPSLQRLDARGCGEYALLEAFKAKRPDCAVTYQVDLGGSSHDLDAVDLVLRVGEYDYDSLAENLRYLPQLATLTLKTPELSSAQVDILKEAYPQVAIHCTVEIMGTEYDTHTTALNLSALTSADVEKAAEKLAMLPDLATVELMNGAGGTNLTKADVKLLMDAAPNAAFHYTFDFYGVQISTTDTEVTVKNKKIGDEGEAELREALDLMVNCDRFILDNCRFSNEVLAKVREDYREKTKVVWRIKFGDGGSALTDVETIRAVYGLTDDNSVDLIYCEDVVYMDIGHSEFLDAVPFVAGMPDLEYIIVSGAPIKSLEPFRSCKKLKFLEIAYCQYIESAEPLRDCVALEMLNISNTRITDLSPLDDLPLITLFARRDPSGRSLVPAEEQERFQAQHPDCNAQFTGANPYGKGWRTDEDGKKLPHYARIAAAFKYPNAYNNKGIYLDSVEMPD